MPEWLDFLDLDSQLRNIIHEAEKKARPYQDDIARVVRYNQAKMLRVFQAEKVTEECFGESTGYGYNDYGREKLEKVFARLFGAEAALVRPQIVSGTHALNITLFGLLRPGERLLSLTGRPYDTLTRIIGDPHLGNMNAGTLANWGISYAEMDIEQSETDYDLLGNYLDPKTKVAIIQRSRGYSCARPALTVTRLKKIIENVKKINEDVVVFVDNCYGEFVETLEPVEVGADIVAGSLIKNPGGGLAPCGGYIAGKGELIEKIAARLTAPGLGAEVGAFAGKRLFLQGFFFAPHVVGEALKAAIFASVLFELLGYKVVPHYREKRGDIIQAIQLGDPKLVEKFCRAVQYFSPVGAHIQPQAAPMAGYKDKIIMAAGTFVQGGSLEFTADAPMRPPYAVYIQGGLAYEHALMAITGCAQALLS